MSDMPDVDIDVADHDEAVAALLTAIPACQLLAATGVIRPHNTGVYLQKIPVNPLNDLAVFPYDVAEELGFFKIDLLNSHIYKNIISQEDLRRILNEPIDWSWFTHRDFVSRLAQFGSGADTVVHYGPKSILDLACMMAIIRPGKRYLIGQPWDVVREKIWQPEPLYNFKKAHAVAYALSVTVDARIKAPSYFDTMVSEPVSRSSSF